LLQVFISGISLAVGVYVALAPRMARPLYRQFLFHPDPYPHDIDAAPVLGGIQGEDVYFQSRRGHRLHGWVYEKPGNNDWMLVSHGNAGNIANRMELVSLLLRAGVSVFIYDYQGYGQSEGKPDIPDICFDGEAAYDFLVTHKNARQEDIILYGESLGASVAGYISRVRRSKALILQSGFASLERIARESLPILRIYPDFLFPQSFLNNTAVLQQPHPPVLIAHGLNDAVIAFDHADHLFKTAVGKKILLELPESAHSDITISAPDKFQSAIMEFLSGLS
jgi:uncharacterized protein